MQETASEVAKKEAELQEGLERTRQRKVYTPVVDIIERKEDIIVIADMPGIDEKAVDVTLEKDILTIYGSVGAERPENHRLVVSEYGIGDYQRAFKVSDEIDREKIEATVRDGVLRLILPKAGAAQSKKISVQAA